jgi:protein-S-isoprenylcysteine O-methyltransferase Ste14
MAGRGPVSAKLLFISIFMWVVVCLTNSIQPVYFDLLPRIGPLENELVAALGIVLTVVGPAVTFVGFVSMKESFRIGIVEDERVPLITTGAFRHVRNPGFLGMDLVVLGAFLTSPSLILLIVAILVLFLVHIQVIKEENHLQRIHGEIYIDHCTRTGRYLPGMRW